MSKESNHENVFFGDLKYAPEGVLVKKLANAKKEIIEIENEQARRARFTSDERLADRLHRLLHVGVDCDYAYSDWGAGAGLTSCRADFLLLANSISIQYHDAHGAVDGILSMMERTRFGENYREAL
jgi:hypothetical protein